MQLVRFRVKAEPREVLEQLVRSVVANAIAGSLRDEYKEASDERNRSLSQLVPDSAGEPRGWKRRHEVNDRFISELMRAVRCLLDSAKFDSANRLSDWCLALADSLGDAMVRARATVTKGITLARTSENAKALPYFDEAIRLYDEAGDDKSLSMVYWNQAVALTSLNRGPDAVGYYKLSRKLALETGQTWLAATSNYNLGYHHYTQGQYTRALDILAETRTALSLDHW